MSRDEQRREQWRRRALAELAERERLGDVQQPGLGTGPRDWSPAPALSDRSPRRGRVVAVGIAAATAIGIRVLVALFPSSASPAYSDDGPGNFAFREVQRGTQTPVSFDPCEPLHVEINTRTGGPDAVAIVEEGLDQVARASGFTFVVDGVTGRAPDPGRAFPSNIGRPVLVAWTDPGEAPELGGSTIGQAGTITRGAAGSEHYVWGQIQLDGPHLRTLTRSQQVAVVMHEGAHLIGLDHVQDRNEIMNPESGRTDWGPGDRTGLAELGDVDCG